MGFYIDRYKHNIKDENNGKIIGDIYHEDEVEDMLEACVNQKINDSKKQTNIENINNLAEFCKKISKQKDCPS